MSLTDLSYGCQHSVHRSPVAEDNKSGSTRTFFHFRCTNVFGHLAGKWPPLLFATNLGSLSKVKVVSLLMGLTLMFIVMASYLLAWDKGGLLFTASPEHFRPAVVLSSPLARAAPDVSPEGLLDMKPLVDTINSKLDYPPRTPPDEKHIFEAFPHLFSVVPRHFLPGVKSPCWYERFSGELGGDPYRDNHFTLRSKTFKAVCKHLNRSFQQHLVPRQGGLLRLRCLPFFYIIGQPKCGTTDLFHRLLLHPEIKFNTMKEPHWWTRKRFGYIRFKDGFQENFSVEDYLDLFDLAAHKIQEALSGNSGDHRALQLITGEASASTMWDNQAWSYLHRDDKDTEPPFLAQDFIHAVQPEARIVIMLRDPVERWNQHLLPVCHSASIFTAPLSVSVPRLYSDYLYFKVANKSAEDFHLRVLESVHLFQSCLSLSSLRSCVYNTSLSNAMPVRLNLGMYIVFILDWLTVFHRDQILVLRLEDYAANLKMAVKAVFDFLSVGPLSQQVEAALTRRPMLNTRRAADINLGPMLSATRRLLREFHQPFNRKLASVLDNKEFFWTS